MVTHAFNPSIQMTEASGYQFEVSLVYRVSSRTARLHREMLLPTYPQNEKDVVYVLNLFVLYFLQQNKGNSFNMTIIRSYKVSIICLPQLQEVSWEEGWSEGEGGGRGRKRGRGKGRESTSTCVCTKVVQKGKYTALCFFHLFLCLKYCSYSPTNFNRTIFLPLT